MPKRILVLGLLFVLGGILAAWSVIDALFESRINLNFAVFLLPVGVGLLRGKASSQWWARFWIILGYLVLIVVACVALVSPHGVSVTWFGTRIQGHHAIPHALGFMVLFGAGLFTSHRLLYSPKACKYLSRR